MSLSFDQIIKSIEQLPAPEQERIRRWLEMVERSMEKRRLKALRYRQSNWSQTKSQCRLSEGGFRELNSVLN